MRQRDFSDMLEQYLPDPQEAKQREQAELQTKNRRANSAAQLPIEARCDLHGQTAEQARRSVDVFLKDCASRGLRKVLIIHGKGEGILQQAVVRYLEGHPLAGQRTAAPQAEGGRGALVVLVVLVRQKKAAP